MATDLRTAGVDTVRSQSELAAADALPPWLGDDELHRSHQSALVRKDPDHYRPLFPDVPDDLPYVWPVRSVAVLERERRAVERQRLKRSRAAQKAWQTRRRNAGREAGGPPVTR
jgi:hypothetical protein